MQDFTVVIDELPISEGMLLNQKTLIELKANIWNWAENILNKENKDWMQYDKEKDQN